jgi:rhodanese-related sulfurtransferase
MSQMSLSDAITKAATGEITLLDVREAKELHDSGHAAGAIHIPMALLPLQAKAKLTAGKPVAIYCAAGGRAGMAVQTLSALGYQAFNIGGFSDWEKAGGPVSR